MLQIEQLACLTSPPAASSAALRQAAHLVATANTETGALPGLHVVAPAAPSASAVADAARDQMQSFGAEGRLTTHVVPASDDPAATRRAVRDAMEDTGSGLLVIDPPADRGAVPPLADDRTQALLNEEDEPLFFANEARPPDAIENILVPTDLSPESVHTLRYAIELAGGYDASVVLLHAINTSPYVALTPVDRLSLGSSTLTEHRARRRLQQVLEGSRPSDVSIRTRIVFGEPADRVAQFATEQAVDLLVIGSRGAGGRSARVLGPVADRVLHRVACPTVLVQAGDRSLLPTCPATSPA